MSGADKSRIASFDLDAPRTDTHAHLSHIAARLGEDALRALAARWHARAATPGGGPPPDGEPFIMDIGVDPGDLSVRAARFGQLGFVRFAAGLWPGAEALNDSSASLDALARDIDSPRCAALGECGLDYHHMQAPAGAQRALFAEQARMAAEAGLPLLVHSRDAAADTLSVLGSLPEKIPVVIHCFGYGPDEARDFLRSGCFLSFAGNLTYPKSEQLREALRAVPSDRLLFETDAPYMNPAPLRGKPSTPADIGRTIAFAAGIFGVDPEALYRIAHRNAARVFGQR